MPNRRSNTSRSSWDSIQYSGMRCARAERDGQLVNVPLGDRVRFNHSKLDRFVRTLREQTAQARTNGSAAVLVSERI